MRLTTSCAFSWSCVADFFFCLFNNLLGGKVRELAVLVGLKSIFFSVLKWGEPEKPSSMSTYAEGLTIPCLMLECIWL